MNIIFYTVEDYIAFFKEKGLYLYFNEKIGTDRIAEKSRIIEHITFNSNESKENTMFVCKGMTFKAKYLKDALFKGARTYVCDEDMNTQLSTDINASHIVVSDIRKAMALLAQKFYNNCENKLTLTGITGTKGKSTTTYLLKSILDEYEISKGNTETAVISGIDNFDGVNREEAHLTTPEAMNIYTHFSNAVKSNINYLTMEVSSQALKYHRVYGINYNYGCFLNVGEDHISVLEHPDFNDYFNSKLMLFSQCKIAVINLDDKYSSEILQSAKESNVVEKIITFSLNNANADLFAKNIIPSKKGCSFTLVTKNEEIEFEIGLPGAFNISNALCAIAIGKDIGIANDIIFSGLKKARVKGRMEVFSNKENTKTIIVDYAHNKLSFETLFKSIINDYPDSEISIVFGCPGKKAYARRHELAEIAAKYANHIYITEEDHGEDDLEDISNEILKNVEKANGNGIIINNREMAIKKAIAEAKDNSIILITGKGRETRQKRGTLYIDTKSDVEIVEDFLNI